MFVQKNNGRVLLNVVIALLVLIVAGFFVFRSFEAVARVKVVGRADAYDAVTGSVMIYADGGYKEVKGEVGGRVLEAQAINKGEHFTKNAPLVQLDTTDIQKQIDETKRNHEFAQDRLKKELEYKPELKVAEDAFQTAERLYKLNSISKDQLDTQQRNLDGIKNRLALAELDRKKAEDDFKATIDALELTKKRMTIPAPPVDGEVKEPQTYEGALIGAGQTVAIVFSNARIVSAKISEESFSKVKIGQPARVRLLSQGSVQYDAKVSKLLTTADEAQRFEVYLDVQVEDPKTLPDILKPGSTGEVTITVGVHPNQIVIPRRARFANDKVFVVKDGRVQLRTIEVGFDSSLNVIEVRKGLQEGELVIVDNLDQFRDGQRVKMQKIE